MFGMIMNNMRAWQDGMNAAGQAWLKAPHDVYRQSYAFMKAYTDCFEESLNISEDDMDLSEFDRTVPDQEEQDTPKRASAARSQQRPHQAQSSRDMGNPMAQIMSESTRMTENWLDQMRGLMGQGKIMQDKSHFKAPFDYWQKQTENMSQAASSSDQWSIFKEGVAKNPLNELEPDEPSISMFDETNMRMEDDELTTGKVVYSDHLLELRQHNPKGTRLKSTPILIISSWLNKYYTLGMIDGNAFVQWMLDQGYMVFVANWHEETESLAADKLSDNMQMGIINCVKVIQKMTNQKEINMVRPRLVRKRIINKKQRV